MHCDADTGSSTGSRQILGANPAVRRAWLSHNASRWPRRRRSRPRRSAENVVGAARAPLGIGGPIRVNGEHAHGLFHVPFATTGGR
jgi:hypothetical protein